MTWKTRTRKRPLPERRADASVARPAKDVVDAGNDESQSKCPTPIAGALGVPLDPLPGPRAVPHEPGDRPAADDLSAVVPTQAIVFLARNG